MTETLLEAPFSLIRLDGVDSTNDEARRLALSGAAADLLVIQADRQTAGRGRRGRVWDSPSGNLHFSMLIRVDSQSTAAQLGFAAAAAMCSALSELISGPDFQAKWPNDVLADGKKLCGMLLEAAETHWLILGIGVDVAAAPAAEGLNHPACCLRDLGATSGALDVLAAFCRHFLPLLNAWRELGFAPVRRAWLERARGVTQPTVVRLENQTLTGIFTDLDSDGALILDQGPDGIRRILAGDVFFPDASGR